MTGNATQNFLLGDWLVEPAAGRVSRGEDSASLRPREMDLLVYLAARPGEVTPADNIIRDVWSGVHVTNDSLYFSISQLRKVLDEKSENGSVIETIPKRGYRLKATVKPAPAGNAADVTAEPPRPAAEAAPDATGSDDHAEPPSAEPESELGRMPAGEAAAVSAARVSTPAGPSRALGMAAAVIAVVGLLAWWLSSSEEPAPAAEVETVAVTDAESASIAVMPFIDLTPDTDYTYFSDGITEEILNRLTRVPGLQVAARTSSFTFKDSAATVIEIGQSLGVANLLEGSVRKEGDRVRVAVQLIDAATGFRRWSETYDRRVTSVFEIQNEISRHVADALQITLAGNGIGGDKADAPASPEVLDEYLLGLEALRTQSFESLEAAEAHFETVLDMDPSFTNARVQLAATQLERVNTGATSDRTLVTESIAMLETAIAADPENAAAYRNLGRARMWIGEREEARRALDRALELSPSDSEALIVRAQLEGGEGDMREARRLLQRAVRLDPFSSAVLHYHSLAERGFGAIGNAREARQRAVDLHPKNPNAAWLLGKLKVTDLGDLAGGLDDFLRAANLDTADYELAAYVAATYFTLGMPEAARPWIERAERDAPEAGTTLALKAIEAALHGQDETALETSLQALNADDMRISAHALVTQVFLPLAATDIDRAGGADNAIARLESLQKSVKEESYEDIHVSASRDELIAFLDLPRRRLVTLAALYKAAGRTEELDAAMERLAFTRLDAVSEFRDRVRSDDYFVEAELRAIEDDTEGAFEMLDKAIANDYLYLWQINYGRNPAFEPLRPDPRWEEAMGRIRARIAGERQLASADLELSARLGHE